MTQKHCGTSFPDREKGRVQEERRKLAEVTVDLRLGASIRILDVVREVAAVATGTSSKTEVRQNLMKEVNRVRAMIPDIPGKD